jgi:ferritin
MISKAMQDAINEQIKNEFYSAYLYLAMSAHFEEQNLGGFSTWLRVQFQEEQGHALKFMDYLYERGGSVKLRAIDQPPSEFGTHLAVFQQVLEHEQKVTGLIHKLYELALKENDYASQVMLQWFISEQVEEEENATEILALLRKAKDSVGALFYVDKALGKRQLAAEAK